MSTQPSPEALVPPYKVVCELFLDPVSERPAIQVSVELGTHRTGQVGLWISPTHHFPFLLIQDIFGMIEQTLLLAVESRYGIQEALQLE